jgi:hypothetical protein
MQREDFELFVREANQHVYELSNQSKNYRKFKNFEMLVIFLQHILLFGEFFEKCTCG